jgi:hypothetical protein
MATSLSDLPRFLVLDPMSTVRLEIHLAAPSCEINVELDNPAAGRSFVLLIGHPGGPYVQRVRLSGRARIHFDPEAPGDYVLLLANPNRQPVVLRIRARDLPKGAPVRAALPRRPASPRDRPRTRPRPRSGRKPRSTERRRAVTGRMPTGLESDSVRPRKS